MKTIGQTDSIVKVLNVQLGNWIKQYIKSVKYWPSLIQDIYSIFQNKQIKQNKLQQASYSMV